MLPILAFSPQAFCESVRGGGPGDSGLRQRTQFSSRVRPTLPPVPSSFISNSADLLLSWSPRPISPPSLGPAKTQMRKWTVGGAMIPPSHPASEPPRLSASHRGRGGKGKAGSFQKAETARGGSMQCCLGATGIRKSGTGGRGQRDPISG